MLEHDRGPDDRVAATPLRSETPDSVAWAQLAARLATETSWRRRVIEEITDAIVRELPIFGRDSELAAAVRDSVDDNARLFIAMVERGVAPGDAEPPPWRARSSGWSSTGGSRSRR